MHLIYSQEANRFEVLSAFSEKDAVKSLGCQWDKVARRWFTKDAKIASKLRGDADDLAIDALDAALARDTATVAASRATDADLAIPVPDGCEYMAFQRAGIAYAAARPGTLIADEMGLGKTVQALGVANVMLAEGGKPALRILVIAPKIALRNWSREASKWLVKPHRIAVWNTSKQPECDMVVVNYDIMSKPALQAAVRAVDWDLLVCDESHNLKNAKAGRTIAILGGGKGDKRIEGIRAARKLFLSGTPILNRPIELHTVLQAIGLPEAQSFWRFAERFCGATRGEYGIDTSGATHLDELQEILRRSVMVRRLKADVLTELPAKRYQVVELDADTAPVKAAVAAEMAATARLEATAAVLKARVAMASTAGSPHALRQAVAALREGKLAAFTEMSKLRHDTAVAKIPQVVEHVLTALDGSDESVLVMAHHKDVIAGIRDGLAEGGYDAAVITGDTGDDARQRAQDDIQGRRKRVFIGSMKACGVNITLTAATTVIMAEQDWTPGIMLQAEDRAHRIGQVNAVVVQYLVVDGSFDATMAKTVAAKSGVIEDALDTLPGAAEPEEIAESDASVPEIGAAVTPEPARGPETPAIASGTEPDTAGIETPADVEIAASASLATSADQPKPRRARGTARSGAAPLTSAERQARHRKVAGKVKLEVSGTLAAQIKAAREGRGITLEALLAAALAALGQ